MPDPSYRGQFLWHELMTSDPRAAASFYGKVFGWGTLKWEHDPSYVLFTDRGAPAAGLMATPPEARAMGAPPSWMLYIGSPDVHVTAWEAQRLGGKLLKAAVKTPSVGTWAVIQDPQGAVFAAFTPEPPAPGSPPPRQDAFSWHELATTDAAAAFQFYHELFGWEKTDAFDMGPAGVYQMYGWGKQTLGGIYRKPSEMRAPPHWLAYTEVADSKRTAELIRQGGGKILSGPMEVPGGDWIVTATDPQGAAFAVHSLKAKRVAPKKTPRTKGRAKKAAARKSPKAKAATRGTKRKRTGRK